MVAKVYITKEAALDSICTACEVVPIEEKENCPYRFSGCQEYSSVFALPAADVVEVVRCGECQHYNDKLEMYSDYVCTIRHYCDGSPIIVGKDDFCSSGKRKDGGQD